LGGGHQDARGRVGGCGGLSIAAALLELAHEQLAQVAKGQLLLRLLQPLELAGG
jgi:hypothetical protein